MIIKTIVGALFIKIEFYGVCKNDRGLYFFSRGVLNCIKTVFIRHHETTGLIPKISVLFSLYRAISLILGINCLIFGEVALFSLPV